MSAGASSTYSTLGVWLCLLVCSGVLAQLVCGQSVNYYGQGYPGAPGTPYQGFESGGNVLVCSPNFTVPSAQSLQGVGLSYHQAEDEQEIAFYAGLYQLAGGDYSIHTLVAAADGGQNVTLPAYSSPTVTVPVAFLNLTGNFTLYAGFNGTLQAGTQYAACYLSNGILDVFYSSAGVPGVNVPAQFANGLPLSVSASQAAANAAQVSFAVWVATSPASPASAPSPSSSSSSAASVASSASSGSFVSGASSLSSSPSVLLRSSTASQSAVTSARAVGITSSSSGVTSTSSSSTGAGSVTSSSSSVSSISSGSSSSSASSAGVVLPPLPANAAHTTTASVSAMRAAIIVLLALVALLQ